MLKPASAALGLTNLTAPIFAKPKRCAWFPRYFWVEAAAQQALKLRGSALPESGHIARPCDGLTALFGARGRYERSGARLQRAESRWAECKAAL